MYRYVQPRKGAGIRATVQNSGLLKAAPRTFLRFAEGAISQPNQGGYNLKPLANAQIPRIIPPSTRMFYPVM